MPDADALRIALGAFNAASPFNRWAGFEIVAAEPGKATLALLARVELLNHADALHAGVQSALLDTAAGYAAGTLAGNVVTLQLSLQFIAAAKGDRFEARAEVVRAGKKQVFAEARLFAIIGGDAMLVASASLVLARLG